MPETTSLRTCRERVASTEQRAIAYSVQAQTDMIRYEKLQGEEYMVVPIVALVEGILTPGNSSLKELALASEFGQAPVTWNGRPITLNHPKRAGSYVSASQTPQIFGEEQLGFIFNSKIEDKKLKVEAWINTKRVNDAGDTVVKEIDRLKNGEIVEVSTGLFTALEEAPGVYMGEHYDVIWRSPIPDHLAILQTGTIGACSVADGCGANRVNELVSRANCADKKDCGCGCSHKEEHEMPKEDNHVLTAEEKVMKAAIEGFKSLSEKFGDTFKLVGNSAVLSDTDTRAALFSALEMEDDNCWWNDIVAVYADNFIYMRNWDGKFLQRTYSISSDGTVVLGSEKVQVRPETTFVPVKVMEETTMTATPKVNESEADPKDPTLPAGTPDPKLPEGTPAPTTNAAPKVLSTEEYLAQAPVEIRESLQDALRLQADRRAELIQGIKANKANAFGDDELKDMPMATLEKLAKLGNVRSYEGRAGGNVPEIKGNETADQYTPALKVFEAPKAV